MRVIKIELSSKLSIHKPENLKDEDCIVHAWTGGVKGAKAHGFDLEVINKVNESWVSINFNRNEALYLRNFINSFLNELDIDPEDED